MHGTEQVSAWIARFAHLIAPESRVLDMACGAGRHSLYFLNRNTSVIAVDIAQAALDLIANQLTPEQSKRYQLLCADLENTPEGEAWALAGRRFDAIVVTNYLWRQRLPDLLQLLAPNGVLLYETFAQGNETVGKPSRAEFLLRPGELLKVCAQAGLRVIAYEDGFLNSPDRFVQRIVAVRESSEKNLESPMRYVL